MAQQLNADAALPEDWRSVRSTTLVASQPLVTPAPGASNTVGFRQHLHSSAHTHTDLYI